MLPPDRLRQIAADLIDIADAIENAARPSNTGRAFLLEALQDLAAALLGGMPEAEAVLMVSARHGIAASEIREAWSASGKRRRTIERMKTAAVIDAMTDAGYRNADIGLVIGVHEKHVPRLRKSLRRHGT